MHIFNDFKLIYQQGYNIPKKFSEKGIEISNLIIKIRLFLIISFYNANNSQNKNIVIFCILVYNNLCFKGQCRGG